MAPYYQVEKYDGYMRISSAHAYRQIKPVFVYLLEGTERAMLIDTGYGLGNLPEFLSTQIDRPLFIVCTHGHSAHTGGNARFKIPVYLHEQDWPLCMQTNSIAARRGIIRRVEPEALPAGFKKEAYIQRGTGGLLLCRSGDFFDLGEDTVEIVHTPGHTAGSISVWWPKRRLMFIGDATGPVTYLHLPESTDKQSYLQTLDRLIFYEADAYWSSHYQQVLTLEDLIRYKQLALEAEYAKGLPIQTLVRQAWLTDISDTSRHPRVCFDGHSPDAAAVVIGDNWES